MQKYKIYWKGGQDSTVGVAVLEVEWLVSNVEQVKRVSERLMVVKMVTGKRLVNILSANKPRQPSQKRRKTPSGAGCRTHWLGCHLESFSCYEET
jgi:hypothetical protein